MAIYRGPGGAGDATGDATNASTLALAAKDEAQASATSAASSATAAANSATAADTSADEAATSATNAAGSATTASTAATNASNLASDASDSADAAAASASDADDSATAAASSASTATTQASNAASSASAASTSASNASTSATNASNSASSASTSASNAATSATNAAASATLAASYTPSQTGNSGKFLTTDGTSTSWGTVSNAPSDGDKGDITVSGSGTVWTIDSASVTDAKLSLSANASNIKTALNASGSAPIYACRTWVNFNGTGTVAIRASGNVSSITDNGVGDYTVNFTNAMSDGSYSFSAHSNNGAGAAAYTHAPYITMTTSALRLYTTNSAGSLTDQSYVLINIFR